MALDVYKVQKIMLENGISQKELAKKSEIQESVLSKILNKKVSKPNIKTIHSLAKGLEINPIEIIKEE
jgi:transcriptional regulator with XRE-family HTH domain